MKYSKELKTGIVVVLAVGLLIYGFNFLKGRDIFSTDMDLYAVYDHVDGLTSNNTVQINGFKVGTVRDIHLDPKTNKLVVHFIITDDNAIITKRSTAMIFSDGLLGYKAIQIAAMSGTEKVKDGDTLIGANESGLKDQVSEMVLPLKKKLEGLVSSVDSVVQIFQAVLNQNARQDLVSSFASIRTSLATFEKTSLRLDSMVATEKVKFSDILTKVQSISTNLANNNEPLSRAINNFANISDSLAKSRLKTTIDSASAVMARVAVIMDKINTGQGSIGMLVNDKKLYTDLTQSSADLDALLTDMKKYPGRYFSIFGKKDKPKKNQNPNNGGNPPPGNGP
ncbi:MAG TPA: MlaD family protein [Bacteroidia bacterium]|nr:MlaD family protein [Bacteroidia bacterium]